MRKTVRCCLYVEKLACIPKRMVIFFVTKIIALLTTYNKKETVKVTPLAGWVYGDPVKKRNSTHFCLNVNYYTTLPLDLTTTTRWATCQTMILCVFSGHGGCTPATILPTKHLFVRSEPIIVWHITSLFHLRDPSRNPIIGGIPQHFFETLIRRELLYVCAVVLTNAPSSSTRKQSE